MLRLRTVWAAAALLSAPAAIGSLRGQEDGDGVSRKSAAGLTQRELALVLQLSPLPPLPPDPSNRYADDPGAARLGRHLYFDPALSGNGAIACSTCHDPARELSDGKAQADGLARAERRAPSLWNVAYSRWFFWDGRADSLWSQALQPLESETEMGGDRAAIARHLASEPALAAAYAAVFGPLPDLTDAARFPRRAKPMPDAEGDLRHRAWVAMGEEDRRAIDRVFANVGKALSAHVRRLVRAEAPFDRFVEGLRAGDAEKQAALSAPAVRGLALFLGKGRCRLCHVGPTFSDGEFHDLGLPTADGALPRDPGRYEGIRRLLDGPFSSAGEHADGGREEARRRLAALERSPERWGEFKTPSLRSLGAGPFMHAGQLATLGDVLRFYSTREGAAPVHRHQEQLLTPLQLTESELDDLEAFLRSLAGEPRDPGALEPLDLCAGR